MKDTHKNILQHCSHQEYYILNWFGLTCLLSSLRVCALQSYHRVTCYERYTRCLQYSLCLYPDDFCLLSVLFIIFLSLSSCHLAHSFFIFIFLTLIFFVSHLSFGKLALFLSSTQSLCFDFGFFAWYLLSSSLWFALSPLAFSSLVLSVYIICRLSLQRSVVLSLSLLTSVCFGFGWIKLPAREACGGGVQRTCAIRLWKKRRQDWSEKKWTTQTHTYIQTHTHRQTWMQCGWVHREQERYKEYNDRRDLCVCVC